MSCATASFKPVAPVRRGAAPPTSSEPFDVCTSGPASAKSRPVESVKPSASIETVSSAYLTVAFCGPS